MGVLLWCLCTSSVLAEGSAAPRVAIVSDANCEDLAALVTSELSSGTAVTVVERDNLAKIGDEAKLQQFASDDAVALGKLAGANGLLFLEQRVDGSHVRFTAVNLGYALFDDPVPAGSDLPKEAKAIAHLMTDAAAKLSLDPAKAVPVSILNLRADVSTPGLAKIERDLTLLLEGRLASIPEVVVLERRHAWDLGFERSLDPAVQPLLRGAYLVDGSLDQPSSSDFGLTVNLRLRSPQGQESQVSISGSTVDLSSLAEKVVAEIRRHVGLNDSISAWNSKKEAHEYLEEGVWAWQHGTPEEAKEAMDSAELLGETSPEFLNLRTNILCDRASQGLNMLAGELPGPLPAGSAPLEQRAEDVLDAIQTAKKGGNRNRVITVASKLLVVMDGANSPRADEVRQAVRALADYDPLHGSPGEGGRSEISLCPELYADDWSLSLEEEEAYYRWLCAPLHWMPFELFAKQGEGFCPRFLKTSVEQKLAFAEFGRSLRDEPKARLAYLLFLSGSSDPDVADRAFSAYVTELWNHREAAVRANRLPLEWKAFRSLPDSFLRKHSSELVSLVRYFLTHWNNMDSFTDLHYLWQPEIWSEPDAVRVWRDYQQFKLRVPDYWKAKGYVMSSLPISLALEFEDPFRRQFPQIASPSVPEVAASPLIISHFWYAPRTPGIPFGRFWYGNWALTKESLWIHGISIGNSSFIYRIHLPSLESETIKMPSGALYTQIRVTSDAVYARYISLSEGKIQGLARYDRTTKTWTLRPMSLPFMQFYIVNDAIYLDLQSIEMTKGGETGIARYDWASDQAIVLASSRRKPAQNQFDDLTDRMAITTSQVSDIFAGPGGRPCVTNFTGTFYIQEKPGNWPPVFDAASWEHAVTFTDGTLVSSDAGEVALLSPEHSEPEYLMAPSLPQFRKLPPYPKKEFASWAPTAFWTAPDHVEIQMDGYCEDNLGVHQDYFFVLVAPFQAKGVYSLLVYSRKTGRIPRTIPLQFKLDSMTRNCLAPLYQGNHDEGFSVDSIEHPGSPFFNVDLIATNQGLCFHLYAGGVWFLPYTEVDDYLKTHPSIFSEASP